MSYVASTQRERDSRTRWRFWCVLNDTPAHCWPMPTACFSDPEAAIAFGQTFGPSKHSWGRVGDTETGQTLHIFITPHTDPTVCPLCDLKLPEGCHGSNRDDLGCRWEGS
jgi:hypothetical protein